MALKLNLLLKLHFFKQKMSKTQKEFDALYLIVDYTLNIKVS